MTLRQEVAELARGFGPSYFQHCVDAGEPIEELWAALGKAGYLGIHLPTSVGGGGAGLEQLAVVVEETAAAGVPVLSALFSVGVGGAILAEHGTAAQQQRWLTGLASGVTRGAFAMTEQAAGTNSHNLATTAELDGDEWVLDGRKYHVTGVDHADWMIVVARTGTDPRSGRGRLTMFLVDVETPGVELAPVPTALQIPERQFAITFDAVRVSADRVIGTVDHGLRGAFAGMNVERMLVSSLCLGVGRYALAKAVEYARGRSVWDGPLGSHQAVAHPLAEAAIHLEAARLMTTRACRLYDSGEDAIELGNMAKLLGVDAGIEALDAAIQTHGGNGLTLEYQLTNYWFLLRMLKIGPVPRELVLNFVAEHTLGLPRSY